MKVKVVGSNGKYLSLVEVPGSQVELGKMYHVVFEEKDDDGNPVYSDDTCWIVNSSTRRPGRLKSEDRATSAVVEELGEFYKAMQFTKLARMFRFSELTMKCYFFGPISFEMTLEE